MIPLLTACTDDAPTKSTSSPSPVSSPDLLPLSIGNTWRFDSQLYDDNGMGIDDAIDSIYVAKQTTWLGTDWYEVVVTRSLDSPGAESWRFWWTNADDGVYDTYEWKADPPSLLFKFPAPAGDSYYSGYDDRTIAVTVVAADSLISVAGNRYRAWMYELSTRVRWTFEPGTGPVRIEILEFVPPTYTERVRVRSILLNSSTTN